MDEQQAQMACGGARVMAVRTLRAFSVDCFRQCQRRSAWGGECPILISTGVYHEPVAFSKFFVGRTVKSSGVETFDEQRGNCNFNRHTRQKYPASKICTHRFSRSALCSVKVSLLPCLETYVISRALSESKTSLRSLNST